MFVIGRINIRNVQETVSTDSKVNKGGLNAGFDIDDSSLVDIADVAFLTGSFDIEFFEQAVFNNRDPTFLRLEDVDQHFFLHRFLFRSGGAAGALCAASKPTPSIRLVGGNPAGDIMPIGKSVRSWRTVNRLNERVSRSHPW